MSTYPRRVLTPTWVDLKAAPTSLVAGSVYIVIASNGPSLLHEGVDAPTGTDGSIPLDSAAKISMAAAETWWARSEGSASVIQINDSE